MNKKRVKADYRLAVGDMVRIPPLRLAPEEAVREVSDNLRNLLAGSVLVEGPGWLVMNKLDLIPEEEREARCQALLDKLDWDGPVYRISAIAKEGTHKLACDIMEFIEARRQRALDDEDFAEALLAEREQVEQESREHMEELEERRRLERAARKAEQGDDDDDYDVEVIYTNE